MLCNQQLQDRMEHPSAANHSRTALQSPTAVKIRRIGIDCLRALALIVAMSPSASDCRNRLICLPARSHPLVQGATTTP